MNVNEYLTKYKEYRQKDYLREKEFGSFFPNITSPILDELFKTFDEIQKLIQLKHDLPEIVKVKLKSFFDSLFSVLNSILNARPNNMSQQNQWSLQKQLSDTHKTVFSGDNNILIILTFLRSTLVQESSEKLLKLQAATENAKVEFENLTKNIQTQTSKLSISNYARIFGSAAEKHSIFCFQKPKRWFKIWNFIRIGSAEKWFLIGFVLLASFVFFVLNINILVSIDFANTHSTVFSYSLRLLIISLFIFMIRFSFKQFSINKHLFTLNQHRQNTLNSFRLFIESIGKDDVEVKNALMLEVAKSIYEQNQTGYINERNTNLSSPSIVELTRLISRKE